MCGQIGRYFFLYFCSAIAFLSCGLTINVIQLVLSLTIKSWNLTLFQKINYYLCYVYFSLYIFIVDWYSDTEINLYMNKDDFKKYFGKEHCYIICNHSYEIDWILLLSVAEKGNIGGNSKTFVKKVAQYIPGFGNVLNFADYIFLARNFDKDKKIIEDKVTEIMNYPDPVWLVIYPEGTRFTPKKHEESLKFANAKGLTTFKHHLYPRIKGFALSLPPMKNKMNAIYDTTLVFNPNDEVKPRIQNLFLGRKIKAHFHIKRIPFESVPTSEEGAGEFLIELYKNKDKMRENYYTTGKFYSESEESNVEKIQLKKNYTVLLIGLFWYIIPVALVLRYFFNLFLAGSYITLFIWIGLFSILGFCMHKAMSMSTLKNTSTYGTNNNYHINKNK